MGLTWILERMQVYHFAVIHLSHNKPSESDIIAILKKICGTYIILQEFSRSSIFIIIFFAEKAYFASKLQNSVQEFFFSLRRPLAP
jgi:hypothetical protein